MISLAARLVCAGALALAAAACTTTGGAPAAGQRATVAFDRVDGLPPAVFDRYVRKLSHEAETQNVPVVTREGFAPYRIKGYVSLWTRQRQATLSWVWEIYDSQGQRVVRLAGDEKAGRTGRGDAWQAVSDEVLARAAQDGMTQLSAYFRAPDAPAPAVATAPSLPAEPSLAPAGRRVASVEPPR